MIRQWNWVIAASMTLAMSVPAFAQLTDSNVLVVYNSLSAIDTDGNGTSDSEDIFNAYQATYAGVYGFDLNDASIDGAMTNGLVTYSEYTSLIRDPIRTYLTTNSLESTVSVITLTKGLPHQIDDTDNAGVGFFPGSVGAEFNAGDSTYASVDSELSLLWQDTTTGESGGDMDSAADNFVLNPYFGSSSSITSFDRSGVTSARTFTAVGTNLDQYAYGGDAGDIYLVARLDGQHVDDVTDAIGRAQSIAYDVNNHFVIIDENSGAGDFDDDDYGDAATSLTGLSYTAVTHDTGADFIVGSNPVGGISGAAPTSDLISVLNTYGGNHSGAGQTNYLNTWIGQLVDGAIFNSLESFNAEGLNGGGGFGDQAQVEQWFANGGTFATGNVFEPFAPLIAQSDELLTQWFTGSLTWIEAAYGSLPALSWQQVILGDPLARASFVVIPEPATLGLLALGAPLVLRRRSHQEAA